MILGCLANISSAPKAVTAPSRLSKSLEAASRRVQAAQMNMQAQALKSEAAKMAMSDKQYASELKRVSSIKDTEARLSATKALNAERERTAQIRHENTMAARREGNLLKEATLKLRERQQGFREEQAHLRRTGTSGGRSGSGIGMGAFGGTPIMGRTTLGMMAGGFGISELVRQSYQMANYSAKTMPMLEFITNDKTKTPEQNKATAASEKTYLDAEIKRLSLDRMSATKGYTQLAGDTYKTLGQQGTRDLFTSIQEVGLVTGRSADDMSRAIKAFSQMASKKQIMS